MERHGFNFTLSEHHKEAAYRKGGNAMRKSYSTAALVAILAAGGLSLTSTNLFADDFVPVGPPATFNQNDLVLPVGPLAFSRPALPRNGGIQIRQSYAGIDFLDSNCSCLPPDTNAAVGNDFVVETVNLQLRVFDKITGIAILDEPLQTLFGASTGGDPYVVYDDIADRWYISAFDSTDQGLFLAVSTDGDPTHPFNTFQLDNVGGFPDYAKLGFNKDAIFISYNNFGPGGGAAVNIASIDKAAALSGTVSYFVSVPQFQFRAMPPAQMHGHHEDDVEWFVSTDGTDAGGTTIRVTEMTNYLSATPTFTYTSLPVAEYRSATRADQPGGRVTTFPNTTMTQVHYNNGFLVTAMASGTASDGFVYPKGLYYEINVNGAPDALPRLVSENVVDPGEGVAVQMPSVAKDEHGNLGLTWMESSSSEYLSMWAGNRYANGAFSAQVAAPGGGFFFVNFRIGDYSTVVVDPTDGRTFWTANEYIGNDGDVDIWRTHITSFQARRRADATSSLP